ncbi:MAG TPA: aminotransferase class III-fold pyridoxal phosphate-dependent enzyme [Pyrinomonadaceae bacterium]|nr:aminotransferase class III-fold pyridoxal phosphate-dependent enzyme [Pyrinomonadaceae bacterium]
MLKTLLGQMVGINPDEVGLDATFTEMGADSLFLLEASQAIRKQFGVKVPFRAMLHEYATINTLASFISQNLTAEEAAATVAAQAPPPSATPPPIREQPAADARPQPASTPVAADQPLILQPSADAPPHAGRREAAPQKSPVESPPGLTPENGLERFLSQQMQLMSQQLDLLRHRRSAKGAHAPVNAAQPAPVVHAAEIAAPAPADPGGAKGQDGAEAPNIVAEVAGAPPSAGTVEKGFDPKPYVAYQPIKRESGDVLTPRQRQHIAKLIAAVNERTQGSKRLAQDNRPVLANNRASAGFGAAWKEMLYPLSTVSASGGRVKDVDGNEYVDLVMGFGALLFGHSPPFLVGAVQEQIARGIQLGVESHLTGQVAALLSEMTGMERIAFCNSGTEAVMSALRLARMKTGRSKIALFEGCYHGTFDGVLVRAEKVTDGKIRAVPLTPGTTQNMIEDVLMLRFGESESLKAIEEHAHELAAVLVEPLPSRRPDLQPGAFLQELRRITSEYGIALIFDEVVTGFRLHPGGAQALYGVRADLVAYGKAVGGGLPISVVAGKAEYIDAIDGGQWDYGDESYPRSEMTFVTGTFFRHPLMMSVVWSVLQHIKSGGPQLYEQLRLRASGLAGTLNTYFEREDVPIRMLQVESMLRFVPHRDVKFMSFFYYHLLEQGVYVSETRSCFLSTAHTDEDIEHVINAVKRTVVAMREGELLPFVLPGADGDKDAKALRPVSPNQPGVAAQDSRTLPLTEAQKAIWALTQMGEDASRAYHESSTMDIPGAFDVAAIRRALQQLVDRHEALRTTFSPEGDFQRVHPALKVEVPLVDFSNLSESEREAQTKDCLTKEVQQSFDLVRGPLIRARIVKLEDARHLLVLTIHHIVSDGWSNGIVQNELAALYAAASQGVAHDLPEPVQFSEYVMAQADEQSAEYKQAESYWVEKYRDSVPTLELPADAPRPAEQTYAGHRQTMTFHAGTYLDLKKLSAQQDATLFTTLLAAFNVMLHHVTKQDDLVVGIHSAGQLAMGGQSLVGHCVNLLPLRSRVSGDPTFAGYLADVKRMTTEAYEHQTYPMLRLIKKLNLRRDPSRMPLVAVVFNLDKIRSEGNSGAASHEGRVNVVANPPAFLQWELSLNIIEVENKLLVGCDHKTDLFDARTVRRWMSYFEAVLRAAVERPEVSLSGIGEALDALDREQESAEEKGLEVARLQKFKSVKRKALKSVA